MSSVVRLIITQGSMRGEAFAFDAHDVAIVGAGDDCHIRLPNDTGLISRHHFLLEVLPPRAMLRDLGSKNGTYVNGQKIGGRARGQNRIEGSTQRFPDTELRDGDIIKVGDLVLRVEIESPTVQPTIRFCQRCQTKLDTSHDPLCAACRELLQNDPDTVRGMLKSDDMREIPIATDYTFVRKLGSGGNGVVYLARHKTNGEPFALKMILPTIILSPQVQAGFRREMDQMRAISHPNIVAFYEGGTANNTLYFLMEFCEHGSVDDLIKQRGRLDVASAIPIMLETLDGLAVVHRHQIVHRDLKPQNLLLGKERVAKIADWGLAKNAEQAGFSGLTVSGSYAGTPAFMPREQITHFKYFKPSSDIWSIGATFYFMLTGRYPRQERPGQTIMEVVLYAEPIPIREREPSIPVRLAAVIDRALNMEIKERYSDAEAMRKALSEVL